MIIAGLRSRGEARRRQAPAMGVIFHKAEWMDSGDDPLLSPTVSLIEQPPGFEFMSHFHRQNQFQVFVGGSGAIGRHTLAPVVVHYAGAYTGYGPLVAGPEGIQYFTLRPVCESGFIPVSQRQSQMLPGPKRHAHSESIAVASTKEMRCWTQACDKFVIPLGADGMGARLVSLPAQATWTCMHPVGSQGQFVFVLQGTAVVTGHALGQWEQLYATHDEAPPVVSAGKEGVQFLCLTVPFKATAYVAGAAL
jgi:hypothetical protein